MIFLTRASGSEDEPVISSGGEIGALLYGMMKKGEVEMGEPIELPEESRNNCFAVLCWRRRSTDDKM